MATINYRIKELKKKGNNSQSGKDTEKNNKSKKEQPKSIYIRLKHSTQYDFEIPTGFYVNKNNWSESKQEIKLTKDTAKDYQEINPKLRELRVFVLSEFNIAQKDGTIINRIWLEKLVQRYFERGSKDNAPDKSIYFTDFIDWFIEEVAPFELHPIKKTKRKSRTIQEYKTALKKFTHYEETKGRKFKLTEIDKNYYIGFLKYCEEYHKLNPNTTGGNIKLLNLFMHKADLEGYKICKDYEKKLFVLPANETNDTAFTIEEIKQITNHDFSNNERLDNVRDWTVIGIWTGLRISDFLQLDLSKTKDGFFELENKKTGIFVVIPIHPDVQRILDKRKGFPRKISDQKFNEYIKEMAKEVGINKMIQGAKMVETEVVGFGDEPTKDSRKTYNLYPKHELISSHICRRTFATYHYGKLDTLTIMNITGHKTESQFLKYVKITPRIHAEKMKELWKKQNKDKNATSRKK